MKEIPLLFSTPMVQALLAGRKTQTRRIIKHKLQPVRDEVISSRRMVKPSGWPLMNIDEYTERFCPYGKPGDVLWVRETLYQNGELGLEYVADKECIDEAIIPNDHKPYRNYAFCNIPCIHMPKWAARIWLQVTDIRVERLQDITQEDAQAEGMTTAPHRCPGWKNSLHDFKDCFICPFKVLWNQINGANGHQWDKNEWVWVISFKGLSTTGKPSLLTEKIKQ